MLTFPVSFERLIEGSHRGNSQTKCQSGKWPTMEEQSCAPPGEIGL